MGRWPPYSCTGGILQKNSDFSAVGLSLILIGKSSPGETDISKSSLLATRGPKGAMKERKAEEARSATDAIIVSVQGGGANQAQ